MGRVEGDEVIEVGKGWITLGLKSHSEDFILR